MTIKHHEWMQRQRARELRELPIPHEHRHKTLDDVAVSRGNRDAVTAVEAWLTRAPDYLLQSSDKAGKGLLLFGPPGTGKTLLASVMANSLVGRARATGLVHFMTMEGFNRHRLRKMELGQLFGSSVADEGVWDEWRDHDVAMAKCYEVRVLILDDVGQENTTPHLAKLLNELLRDRYNRGLPTIITSNVDPHDWALRFENESLGSFIFQSCFVVGLAGKDARASR